MWTVLNKSEFPNCSRVNFEIKGMSEAVRNWKLIRILLTETVIYFLWDSNWTLKITGTESEFVRLWFGLFVDYLLTGFQVESGNLACRVDESFPCDMTDIYAFLYDQERE